MSEPTDAEVEAAVQAYMRAYQRATKARKEKGVATLSLREAIREALIAAKEVKLQ